MTKKLWSIIIIVIVGITAIFALSFKKQSTPKITYQEIPVTKSDIKVTILSTGGVEPENRLEIKPPIAGRVETVLVKEGQSVRKGQILAWMSSTERAALIDAARARGDAEVKEWEGLYRPTPIMAPISGMIILRNVEAGQTFANTDYVFVMSNRLTIKAKVDETDIAQIKVHQKAEVVLDAYPNKIIPAHVEKIAYDATTVSNVTTYTVDVLPEEVPAYMRSGMTANVTFLISSKTSVLTVSNDALKTRGDEYSVLVKGMDGKTPEHRKIEVGITDGKHTEIVSGLTEGEIVLVADMNSFTGGSTKQGSNPLDPMSAMKRKKGR